MSDFNRQIGAAGNDEERRRIAREAARLQQPSLSSMGLGFLAGAALTGLLADLLRGVFGRRLRS